MRRYIKKYIYSVKKAKNKKMEKDTPVRSNPNKDSLTILISHGIDFGQEALMVNFKDHNIMIKTSTKQGKNNLNFLYI